MISSCPCSLSTDRIFSASFGISHPWLLEIIFLILSDDSALFVHTTLYDGKLKIGKTGKYKKWNEMIKEEVIGNIPLEFMLAVAGSGIFTDYLRDKVQVENVIVNLVGESSTGKSTAGLLLVSCGAKPTFQTFLFFPTGYIV